MEHKEGENLTCSNQSEEKNFLNTTLKREETCEKKIILTTILEKERERRRKERGSSRWLMTL